MKCMYCPALWFLCRYSRLIERNLDSDQSRRKRLIFFILIFHIFLIIFPLINFLLIILRLTASTSLPALFVGSNEFAREFNNVVGLHLCLRHGGNGLAFV